MAERKIELREPEHDLRSNMTNGMIDKIDKWTTFFQEIFDNINSKWSCGWTDIWMDGSMGHPPF